MKRFVLVVLLSVSSTPFLLAQDNEFVAHIRLIDSLAGMDQPPVDSLWSTSLKFFKSDIDSVAGAVHQAWGSYFIDNYLYDSAKKEMELAVSLYQRAEMEQQLAEALYHLGNLYYDIEDIESAVKTLHRALGIFEKIGNPLMTARTYNALANAYAYIGEFRLSFDYYEKSIDISKQQNDSTEVSKVLGNMAAVYTMKKDYETGLEQFHKALKWSGNNTRQRMDHLIGIGIIKEETKAFDEAEANYREAMTLAREVKDFVQLAYIYHNLAFLFVATDELDSVPIYIRKASELADKYAIRNIKYNIKEISHQYYFKLGEYKRAYELLEEARAESDSFYDLDMTRQLQEVQAQYDALKKQQEIAQKDLELEKAGNQLYQNRLIRNLLIAGLVLVLAFVVVIYRSRRLKVRANDLLRQKNHEIEEKNKRIKSIEEAKSRWFINISHELRTPLTLIKGPIQHALQAIPKNDPVYRDLEIADKNVGQLQKLVTAILDLSKMEEGKMILNPLPANLTELILDVMASFEGAARALKVKLELELDPENPIYMRIDQEKIRNVITNLISNALKFTHEGGYIKVGAKVNEQEIEIYVKDSGDGISSEDIDKVFDRFYQSSNPKFGKQGGTGVGLALCKEIAKLHEGDLSVTSELGKGSSFTLHLPADSRCTREDAEMFSSPKSVSPEPEEESPPSYTSSLKEKRILVVDDNADMREYISGFLKEGYEVIEARDGEEALEKLEKATPDLIVSDVMMPRMDGITFAREVKASEKWRGIPFITVSAIGDEQEKIETLRIGIDDYLVKPFYAEELRVRINNLINNYQERIQLVEEGEEDLSFEARTLKKLEKEVHDHLDDSTFNVLRLAEAAAMSERQLYRYVRQMTGLTPANFIKEIRLQKAMELIQKKVYKRTSQLSYAVGFQQPSYFSNVFKKRFGRMPADYIDA